MFPFFPHRRPPVVRWPHAAFAFLVFTLGFATGHADGGPPAPVRPTVTVQTGDTGGRFFGEKPDPQRVRHYFVAAEQTAWDFAPAGRDDVCGLTLPPAVVANRTAQKIRYVQYTDATFRARVIPDRMLGILGPVLRGVVGDFLVVTFLNRTGQPLSMHPHGVRYDKDSEGAYYYPNPGRGAAVAPGATFTYVWKLDEESGPLPSEPSSRAWLYHSHVNGDTETNLGLVGAIIVTDPKRARPDGTPADVDREFVSLFMIFDESGLNQATPAIISDKPAPSPPVVAPVPAPTPTLTWAEMQERLELGFRYAINGYIFGNQPGLEANEGERTRWYLLALGSEQDFHTAHWHGLRVIEEGRRRTDVVELLPASMKVADLNADNPGAWLFHCHVAEHMREGMFAKLTIYPRGTIGVEREPSIAFLGLPQSERALRVDRAEAVLNLSSLPARAQVVIEGAVTVPESYSVLNQTVTVQLGEKSIAFHPNQQGIATEPRAHLRVKNADETGAVNGALLYFEVVFNGADWIGEGKPAAGPAQPVAFAIEVGAVRHATSAQIVSRVERR